MKNIDKQIDDNYYGIEKSGNTSTRFDVRYYHFITLFLMIIAFVVMFIPIIFAIDIMNYRTFISILLSLLIFCAGLCYFIKKGASRWE